MKKLGLLIASIIIIPLLINCNNSITITWKNYDGSILEVDKNVEKGSIPIYDGIRPTKPKDDTCYYSFDGWDPKVTVVKSSKTYVATYRSIDISDIDTYMKIIIHEGTAPCNFSFLCDKAPDREFMVDWGDDAVDDKTSHIYQFSGEYDIKISGITNIKLSSINRVMVKEIYFGNAITSIDDKAFATSFFLESVVFSDSLKSIGVDAFSDCSSLTNIDIPSVTSIGSGAFSKCIYLTNVTLHNGLRIIDWKSFADCISLVNINIPNSVIRIENSAFKFCSSLTSISIPKNVTSINNYAFDRCLSLSTVDLTALSIPPTLGDEDPFANCNDDLKFYVAKGTKDRYLSTDNWKKYKPYRFVEAQ